MNSDKIRILLGALTIVMLVWVVITLVGQGSSEDEPIISTVTSTFTVTGPPTIVGWMSFWDEEVSYARIVDVMQQFDTFSPMLYHIGGSGSLDDYDISTRNKVLQLAREKNIPIVPTVGDDGERAVVHTLLYDNDARDRFINHLITEAQAQGYVGWAYDIEVVEQTDIRAFSQLIEESARMLHENLLRLDVIVYAKTFNESYPPAKAHDYISIGKAADRVIVMSYGYNNELTGPGGQTPPSWLRNVLRYSIQTIPREKLVVGLSTHGYVWNGDKVVGLTYPEVIELVAKHNLTPSYDPIAGAMKATFQENGDVTVLYFETAETIKDKIDVVRSEFAINSFALWRTGAEDPRIWDLLHNYSLSPSSPESNDQRTHE